MAEAQQPRALEWWHVGIDEFPMNDENRAAYRAATSEFTADRGDRLDWWFSHRAEALRARALLELHGFTAYGPDLDVVSP